MQELPDKSGGGLLRGVWFVFQDGSDVIRAWSSGLTGMERVYVNDELVSQKRSAGLKSEHEFSINGDQFKISFNVISVLKGELLCSLGKNNTMIKKLRTRFNSTAYSFMVSLILIIIFALYAILSLYFAIPRWILVAIVAMVIAVRLAGRKENLFLVEDAG